MGRCCMCVCVELLKIFDTEDGDTESGKTLRAKADMLEQQLAVAGCFSICGVHGAGSLADLLRCVLHFES